MELDIKEQKNRLIRVLAKHQKEFFPVFSFDLKSESFTVFDFTRDNEELAKIDLSVPGNLNKYVFSKIEKDNTKYGVGGYAEDRIIYKDSKIFSLTEEKRSVHLGIDLWIKEGVSIFSPIDGVVHSFNDNVGYGDYGPTIILKHKIEGEVFFTLYGHLSRNSIKDLHIGKEFKSGEKIAEVGGSSVNGGWPPHLHFQIILDMEENEGNFIGVTSYSKQDYYFILCPDPNLILGL